MVISSVDNDLRTLSGNQPVFFEPQGATLDPNKLILDSFMDAVKRGLIFENGKKIKLNISNYSKLMAYVDTRLGKLDQSIIVLEDLSGSEFLFHWDPKLAGFSASGGTSEQYSAEYQLAMQQVYNLCDQQKFDDKVYNYEQGEYLGSSDLTGKVYNGKGLSHKEAVKKVRAELAAAQETVFRLNDFIKVETRPLR